MLREKLPGLFPAPLSPSFPQISSPRSSILARPRRSMFRSPAPTSTPAAPSPTSCSEDPPCPRHRRSPHQEQFQDPALKVDFNRELAGVVGLTEGDAATSIQATLSGSTQTAPTYWLNPQNGVSYPVSVQTPQYGIDTLGELKNLPLTAAQSTQLLGALATFSPEPRNALVSRYDIRPVVNIYATTQGQDLGSVAAEVQKIVNESRAELPRGSTVAIRGRQAP